VTFLHLKNKEIEDPFAASMAMWLGSNASAEFHLDDFITSVSG